MSQAEITSYRPVLYTLAYRMVGCSAAAEDLVQDTFFNWFKIDQRKVNNTKAYLIRSINNACLNYLNSIKQKKEEWIENISPSISALKVNPGFGNLDIKGEVNSALAQLFKKLPPTERAVFLLKGIFNFEYSELTSILGEKAENCRQLFSRAQQKLADEKVRFSPDADRMKKAVVEFKNATLGEFNGLIEGLTKDISK